MKRFALAFAALSLCMVAHADALRSQIEGMNRKLHPVMMNRDIDGFVKIVKSYITKDFKYSEQGKSIGFDKMVAGMKQGFAMMTRMTSEDTVLLSLTQKGQTATGTSQHRMKGITTDKDGTEHKLAFVGTSVETYRLVNGKWLMSSMAWRTQQMTLDGEPIGQATAASGK